MGLERWIIEGGKHFYAENTEGPSLLQRQTFSDLSFATQQLQMNVAPKQALSVTQMKRERSNIEDLPKLFHKSQDNKKLNSPILSCKTVPA